MFALFGGMVGLYIITRMVEIVSARKNQPKVGAAGWLAVITILFTLGAMVYFLLGSDMATALK